ncbi:hypothetical protein [Comamonas thiooxydans]|uniref:hypothetical protein n=1 Tax=Comamonas thiooxydans TaxID=363952 RepID=UPI0005F77AE3|nr:hypothetical protein [Comamonas thiooxydans]CUA99375.1 hypothetical protein Ga0061062_108114 [Comamonas thiooxydans]
MQDKTPEITDSQVIAITTAYVQGMGKGLTAGWSNSEIANPYSSEWGCDAAWRIGYNEGKKRARQEPLEEPEAVAVPDAQEAFELAYATEWHKSRHGDETVEQLAAEVKSWREGATYGDDLPRLRFGWEGYQWALAATTEAGAADGEKMLGPRQNHLPNCNDEACLECSSLIPDEWVSKTPAAAPVVLPETDAAVTEVMGLVQDYFVTGMDKARSTIETKLRALLATATGLPAQVVVEFEQIGTAGPFPISNGRVQLPEVTMVDLARMLKPTIDSLAQADTRDAELLRGLHWATTLLDTPAGDAYHEAMQAEAMNVSDALNGEVAKASIEQYRGILNAGLTAARAAIAAAKGE